MKAFDDREEEGKRSTSADMTGGLEIGAEALTVQVEVTA